MPWLLIGSLVVALPLLTAAVVGAATRSRLPLVARIDWPRLPAVHRSARLAPWRGRRDDSGCGRCSSSWCGCSSGGPLGSFAGRLAEVQENDNAAFLPQSAESTEVLDASWSASQDEETIPATVVVRARRAG